jgi:hypothetical protein
MLSNKANGCGLLHQAPAGGPLLQVPGSDSPIGPHGDYPWGPKECVGFQSRVYGKPIIPDGGISKGPDSGVCKRPKVAKGHRTYVGPSGQVPYDSVRKKKKITTTYLSSTIMRWFYAQSIDSGGQSAFSIST